MAEKDKLILDHLYIARYMAHKYKRPSMPYDDLFQEGCIGLIKACEKFKPELGFKFSTYATWWVKQAILSSITNSSRSIRLPSYIVYLRLKIYKFISNYVNTHGVEPEDSEIAKALNITIDKVNDAQNASSEVDLENFETFVSKEVEDDIIEDLIIEEEYINLINKLGSFTVKERIVIGLKFGILEQI